MSDVSLSVATSQISPQLATATYTERQDQLGGEASPAEPADDETAARSERLERDSRPHARRQHDSDRPPAHAATPRQGWWRLPGWANAGGRGAGWTQGRR